MSSTHDITLNGTGYMIHPGAYKRRQATTDEPAPGTVRLTDFWGGARRAYQWERDRIWSSSGAFPTLDSQGLTAGPKRLDSSETVTPAIDPGAPRWVLTFNGTTYLVQGTAIYQLTQSGASYTGLTLVKSFASPILSATLVESTIVLAFGGAVATQGYQLTSGTTFNPLFSATSLKFASLVASDGDNLVLRNPNDGTGLLRVTDLGGTAGGNGVLGSNPRRLVSVDGHVWALTEQALWRRTGAGSWEVVGTMPPLTRSDDASWAVVSYGKLYSWLGGQVVYYDLTNDVWQAAGLTGQQTHGACAIGLWLIVGITSLLGVPELWGFDGHAWWLIETGTTYTNPLPVSGAAGVWDLYAGRGTTSQQVALWQLFPKAGAAGLRSSWSLTTALMDAGIREQAKSWTSAGVELAWPDGRAGSGSVTVTLESSSNGGASWSSVASGTINGTGARTATVKGSLPAGTSSNWLQLRVTISGIVDWSPVVAGLWATYDLGSSIGASGGVNKRRWELDVACEDRLVLRDSSVETTGARAIARSLWSLWEAGQAVTLRDIDYDLTAAEYTVKLVGIKEVVPKPAEAARWGNGVVSLVLVEV